MTYNEFWFEVGRAIGNGKSGNQRLGQYLFNFLYDHNPVLADAIRATDNDPFYEDTKIGAFAAYLKENWTQ